MPMMSQKLHFADKWHDGKSLATALRHPELVSGSQATVVHYPETSSG
jgi:hypothetical protein